MTYDRNVLTLVARELLPLQFNLLKLYSSLLTNVACL